MIEALSKRFIEHIKKTIAVELQYIIQWVLTIPALWPDIAKDFIREAALRTGLIEKKESHQLILATEPEAAAIHYRQIPVRTFGNTKENLLILQKHEKYLVLNVDETIDITVHQVVEGLKIQEVAVA
jgi:molecular chaperone DnaK (HSP70)